MEVGVTVRFFGVRGSTPCSCSSLQRYGGNTSCVVVQREGEAPIVLDAGTGIRFFGCNHGAGPFEGTILISHLHWDHIQGLPFFGPLLHPDTKVTLAGPPEANESFRAAFGRCLCPPFFPITLDDIAGTVDVIDMDRSSLTAGTATIRAARVPHTGRTNGYRIEWPDLAIAYIPDHQETLDDGGVSSEVLDLAAEADLLIHDAQFTPELLAQRAEWGHCTSRFAADVASQAGAKALALFHHDPLSTDDKVAAIEAEAQGWDYNFEIFAAAEGLKLTL